MGLFSKATKAITKGANLAFNPSSWVSTAKDIGGSTYGKMGMEALGTYLGYPGMGSAIGNMLGGNGSMDDVMKVGGNLYSAYQSRKQSESDYQQYYGDNMALAEYQNNRSRDMAYLQTQWERENADQAQKWNTENMAQANQYNQTNAREQMAFQERMAGTQHQREVNDLRAAGLNPVLSGTGGMGAASPGGASGSVGTPSGPKAGSGAPQAAMLTNVVSSAFSAMKAMADASNVRAQTDYLRGAQTEKTYADTELSQSATAVNKTRAALNQDQSQKIATEVQNLKLIRDNIPKTGQLTEAQTRQVQQSTSNLKQVFRDLKVKGDISEQDQAYWNGLINQSAGSAQGTVKMIQSILQLLK